MMVTALLLYTDDVTLGLSCLAIAVASSRLQDDPNGYRGRQLPPRDLSLIRMQLGQWPYIPRSYFCLLYTSTPYLARDVILHVALYILQSSFLTQDRSEIVSGKDALDGHNLPPI